MRRLFRILRITAGEFVLLLSMFILVIWVRSYFRGDNFQESTQHDTGDRFGWTIQSLEIGKGGIGFRRTAWSAPPAALDASPNLVREVPLGHWRVRPQYPVTHAPPVGIRGMGFQFARYDGWLPDGCTCITTIIVIPFWPLFVIMLALSILPALRLIRWCRALVARCRALTAASRLARNLCPHCAYDLRATPGHCPECGKYRPSASAKPAGTALQ